MTRRYAKPLRDHPWTHTARDIGNLAIGVAVLGGLWAFNVGMLLWDGLRPGQGEAFRPSGGYRTRRG